VERGSRPSTSVEVNALPRQVKLYYSSRCCLQGLVEGPRPLYFWSRCTNSIPRQRRGHHCKRFPMPFLVSRNSLQHPRGVLADSRRHGKSRGREGGRAPPFAPAQHLVGREVGRAPSPGACRTGLNQHQTDYCHSWDTRQFARCVHVLGASLKTLHERPRLLGLAPSPFSRPRAVSTFFFELPSAVSTLSASCRLHFPLSV
jgi:hypothetical protein